MAHLIAPPSSVQPMTREDIAVVQAEKRVDAATREQLVRVYGDSRDPHGRPVDLTRPTHRNWTCTVCGNVSTDIRHVCGTCLSPEPSYVTGRPYGGKQGSGAAEAIKKNTATAAAAESPSVLRAGTSADSGVRLVHIATTKRTYRTFCEPHVPTAPTTSANAAGGRRGGGGEEAVDEMAVKDGDEDAVWDDEPDCGEGQSCRPGGGGACDDGEDGEAVGGASAERHAPREEAVDGGFTHFISIPIGKQPAITANATRVLEDLRSFVEGRAVAAAAASGGEVATPELVTSTQKLHMTLLMLTLPRREDIEFAKELLQGPFAAAWAAVKEKAVAAAAAAEGKKAGASPSLALSGDAALAPAHRHPLLRLGGGLQVMPGGADNDVQQPQKAAVVYMGIDDPLALSTVQQLQRVVHDSFVELIHNVEEAARSRRILHVTIMNKKWRAARGARRPFDARPIIDAFQDAGIGAGDDGRQFFETAELELCSMRRHDAETGTYLAEATVKI